MRRYIFAVTSLVLAGLGTASADIRSSAIELADQAEWSDLYHQYDDLGFATLDGLDRCVMKAMKTFSEEPRPNVNSALFINECNIGMKKFDKAVSEATKFLKQNPDHSFALGQRARAYYAMEDNVHASADASAAVAADSLNYEGWYVLGMITKSQADPKAKEYLEKAVPLSPRELLIHGQATAALETLK